MTLLVKAYHRGLRAHGLALLLIYSSSCLQVRSHVSASCSTCLLPCLLASMDSPDTVSQTQFSSVFYQGNRKVTNLPGFSFDMLQTKNYKTYYILPRFPPHSSKVFAQTYNRITVKIQTIIFTL